LVAAGQGHLDRIQLQRAAHVGELVGQCEGDRAENVLIQLGQLGGLRRGHQVHRAGQLPDHPRGPVAALGSDAAHHPRRLPLDVIGVAGIDALRAEGDIDVLAHGQTALLQGLNEQLPRRADEAGRGKDDRLSRVGVLDDGLAGTLQGGEVRDALLIHRSGNTDDHRVGIGQRGAVAGELEALVGIGRCQPQSVKVGEVDVAGLDGTQAIVTDVEADNRRCAAQQRQRRRQSDIAEAHDRD
jgi:hypothetical protein